jgi:hypothetical protein
MQAMLASPEHQAAVEAMQVRNGGFGPGQSTVLMLIE